MQTVFAPGGAEPMLRGSNGSWFAPSSFGADFTTFGPSFDPSAITDGPRYQALDFNHAFALSTQHDWKTYDIYGRLIQSGPAHANRGLMSTNLPSFYVPMDLRRPNAPYRLAPLIVESFTGMLFGEGHAPEIEAEGDSDTKDFVEGLIQAGELNALMLEARDVGGGTGTVGISWRFADGLPRARVHNGKHLWTHVWADEEAQIPEHVSEIVKVAKDVPNAKGKMERRWFWRRRDWTPLADLAFLDCSCDEPPVWIVDEAQTTIHGEGETHFVWIANLPDDDEATRIDGRPDFDGLHEPLTALDTLSSVVTTGGIRNLDPTLVLKVDPELAKRGVRKGSDNALTVGKDGGADYLEMAGTSITAGLALIDKLEKQILKVAQCVIPDPDTVSAAGTSSLALRLLYKPMNSKSNLLRVRYGGGYVRLLEQMLRSARRYLPSVDRETGIAVYPAERATVRDEATGEEHEVEQEIEFTLRLPPKVIEERVRDAQGQPTGNVMKRARERTPGSAEHVSLVWPEYFPPTESEKQARATTLVSATGGKSIMSQESAAESWAVFSGEKDAEGEWLKLQAQEAARARAEAGMFLSTDPAAAVGTTEGTPPLAVLPDEDLPPLPFGVREKPPEEDAKDDGPAPPPTQDIQVSTDFVLNGAQIAAATQIVTAVVAGELPRDAGLGQLKILFNLTPAQALAIMGSAGTVQSGNGGAPPGGIAPGQEGGAPGSTAAGGAAGAPPRPGPASGPPGPSTR